MEITELWSKIVIYVTSALGSISIGAIISWVIAIANSARIKKTIAQFRANEIANAAVDNGLEKIKTITYKHDIQPLVESELKKVNEYSVEVLKKELAMVRLQYAQLIGIIEALSHYFDNAYGVNEDAKEDLQAQIDNAKNSVIETESAESQVIVAEHNEIAEEEPVAGTKTTKVIR